MEVPGEGFFLHGNLTDGRFEEKIVLMDRLLSSGWSLMRTVSHRVVSYQGGLLQGGLMTRLS